MLNKITLGFFGLWLVEWKRGGRLLKSERKSVKKRAQQHNGGHEKDGGTGKGGGGVGAGNHMQVI